MTVPTRTAAAGAAPTSPPIDSEAAIPSWRKLLAAATLTDCADPEPVAVLEQVRPKLQLMCAPLPM